MNVYEFLRYLRRDVASEFSSYQSVLSIHSLSADVSDPHLWVWLGGEGKAVGFASPDESKLGDQIGQWTSRKMTGIKIRDRVKAGSVIADTSALIDGLISKLIEFGLLKHSKIGIPVAATLELARLDEAGKRDDKDKSLSEKSRKGLDELSRLRRFDDEGVVTLDLDLGESVDWSVPLDSVPRSTIMDKAIRKVANERKSLLVTCDSGLARLASTYPNVTVLYSHVALVIRYAPAWRLWWLLMNWGQEQELAFDYRYENGKVAKLRFSVQSEDEIILRKIG
jgi:uncharacterized protein YacL